MAQMTRYEKRVRITLLLIICLFFIVVILSIIEFKQGTYTPQLHKLVLDKEWILALISAIGIYIGVWLFHDLRSEHVEIKQSARRKRFLQESDDSKDILEKIKKKNKE
jgi:hypothetical protein